MRIQAEQWIERRCGCGRQRELGGDRFNLGHADLKLFYWIGQIVCLLHEMALVVLSCL